jgi:DNA mismatch repair protein MutS2
MHIFPSESLSQLEFDKVCQEIENHCRNQSSKEWVKSLKPLTDKNRIIQLLGQTFEYKTILQNKSPFPDTEFIPVQKEAVLIKAQGAVLNETQFYNIRAISITVNELLLFLNERTAQYPCLNQLFEPVYHTTDIIDAINLIIEEREAYVKSSASRDLAEIRQNLSAKRRESEKRFRSYLNEMKKLGWIRETEESFYNGRKVLAVLAEYKRDVKGLVHGSSDTGKTAFIEPYNTIEINNEITNLEQDEKREVFRLLRQLSDKLRPYSELIGNYQKTLSLLDFTRAKAKYALHIGANLPVIASEPVIKLMEAVHPVLWQHNKSLAKPTLPISFLLNTEKRILIISGPNAGGKSITLKTVGLLQVMMQSGLLIPAKEGSELGIVQHLMCDIGDSQSIEYELSTYSSRLIKAKHFLTLAGKRSLILIDELGTGSDPELGGAIAEVMVEEIHKKRALSIITTHYANIKIMAENFPAIQNASMLFDADTLMPRYLLSIGQPGSSFTFEVAQKIGLPKEIIQRASQKVKGGKLRMDKMLSTLQREKHKAEQFQKQLLEAEQKSQDSKLKYEELFDKLRQKNEQQKLKADETARLGELGRKLEQIIQAFKSSKDRKEAHNRLNKILLAENKKQLDLAAQQKQEKRKKKKIEKIKAEIKIGSVVRLLNSRQKGIVEELSKGKARVIFGEIKSQVAIENLEVCE